MKHYLQILERIRTKPCLIWSIFAHPTILSFIQWVLLVIFTLVVIDLLRIVGIRNLEVLIPEGLPILFECIMRSENIAIVSTLLVGSVLLYLFCQDKCNSICSGEKTLRCIWSMRDFGFALKSQETIKASVSLDTYTDMGLLTDTNDTTTK